MIIERRSQKQQATGGRRAAAPGGSPRGDGRREGPHNDESAYGSAMRARQMMSPDRRGAAASANLDGSGQCIALIDLNSTDKHGRITGGGYLTSDLESFFRKLKRSVPDIGAIGVAGGVNRLGHNRTADSEVTMDIEVAGGGWLPTPMTSLGGLCLELLSGKGLESAFLEGIGLKHETVLCHHGAVVPKTPMETRTVPWLHRLRLPPRGHLPNRHNGEPSVLSRSRVRCVSFSPLKSGNKSNKPPASTVAGTGFAGHCNPSS